MLVEGASDRIALETLARRRGRDLAAEGVEVRSIGGAQAIGRVVAELAPTVAVAGMCDAGEEAEFRRAFDGVKTLGYTVCVADLEDELIRALGPEVVKGVLDANGDLRPFRTMQKQPGWRGRPTEDQLRRFIGSGARRKLRYAAFLVDALDLDNVPPPLDDVLALV